MIVIIIERIEVEGEETPVAIIILTHTTLSYLSQLEKKNYGMKADVASELQSCDFGMGFTYFMLVRNEVPKSLGHRGSGLRASHY